MYGKLPKVCASFCSFLKGEILIDFRMEIKEEMKMNVIHEILNLKLGEKSNFELYIYIYIH